MPTKTVPNIPASNGDGRLDRIAIKLRGGVAYLHPTKIDWIEAHGERIRIHVGDKSYERRESLAYFENMLASLDFLRVHRTAIVNLDRVVELRVPSSGPEHVILADGTQIPLGRRRRRTLERALTGARSRFDE